MRFGCVHDSCLFLVIGTGRVLATVDSASTTNQKELNASRHGQRSVLAMGRRIGRNFWCLFMATVTSQKSGTFKTKKKRLLFTKAHHAGSQHLKQCDRQKRSELPFVRFERGSKTMVIFQHMFQSRTWCETLYIEHPQTATLTSIVWRRDWTINKLVCTLTILPSNGQSAKRRNKRTNITSKVASRLMITPYFPNFQHPDINQHAAIKQKKEASPLWHQKGICALWYRVFTRATLPPPRGSTLAHRLPLIHPLHRRWGALASKAFFVPRVRTRPAVQTSQHTLTGWVHVHKTASNQPTNQPC